MERYNMNKQFKELNEHSIWLLIATIGCWGIPNVIIQAIAIFLVFLLTLYKIQSLEKQIKENKKVRLNLIKNLYGQYLTDSRLKMFRRKMRQVAIKQLWITVWCGAFVFLSLFLIGTKFGFELVSAYKSDNILMFLLSL
jgi:hypothetical protein